MTLPFSPDADARAFRNALGRFVTGVTLVTVATDQGPVGFAANSFTSVSMDPPLVLWCPAKSSSRFHHYEHARHYAIHVLSAAQAALLPRFARGGAGFDGLAHDLNAEGVPVLPDALARFDCDRFAVHDAGDHLIIVGRVLRAMMAEGDPLAFGMGRYGGFAG